MGRRRSASSVTDLLSGIVDDIKDFLDDEVIDRGRNRERDLRRSGRRFADDRHAGQRTTGGELADLREALRTLDGCIATLVAARTEAPGRAANPDTARADAATVATAAAPAPAEAHGEPWPGYDELTVAQIRGELVGRGAETVERVRAYEQAHKRRRGVLALTEPAVAVTG